MRSRHLLASLLALLPVSAIAGCLSLHGVLTITTPGDADGNGAVDIWDVRSIARCVDSKHFRVLCPENADVTQNGVVDKGDAEAIEKVVHGQSTVAISAGNDVGDSLFIGGNVVVRVAETLDRKSVV